MTIAVLADVHANLPAFEAVLGETKELGCERIYHAGDLIGIGPFPAECVDLAVSAGVRCVMGNHEEWVTRGLPVDPTPSIDDDEFMHHHWVLSRLDKARRNAIQSFPYQICEGVDDVVLTVVHFALEPDGRTFKPADPKETDRELLGKFNETDGDLICFGHLHEKAMDCRFRGRRFLNPGSVGCAHRAEARFATVEFSRGEFMISEHTAQYDRSRLLRRYDELEIPARDFIRKYFFGVEDS